MKVTYLTTSNVNITYTAGIQSETFLDITS